MYQCAKIFNLRWEKFLVESTKNHALLGNVDLSTVNYFEFVWSFSALNLWCVCMPMLATINELRPEDRKDQMLMM